jgi:hypothetical protein
MWFGTGSNYKEESILPTQTTILFTFTGNWQVFLKPVKKGLQNLIFKKTKLSLAINSKIIFLHP